MRKLKTARRGEIVDAALDIAAESGLDGISMRVVAARVGLTPMALYGYFRSKDDLVDALLDRLLGEVPLPPADLPWRDLLARLLRELRAVVRRYPAVVPLVLAQPAGGTQTLRAIDLVYQALLRAGVPADQVPRLERLLTTLAIGVAASETGGRFSPGGLSPAQRRAQLAPDELPAHHRLAAELDAPVDWDVEFEADLADLLDTVGRIGRSRGRR